MATVDECRAALHDLAARLAEVDPDLRRKHSVDRTLSCHLSDLGVTFSGTLSEDGLHDVTDDVSRQPLQEAQVRLTMTSDDLLALCSGDLAFPGAWARGRVRIDASVLDLLRLRNLM